jgi:hypothetical protein
MHTINQFFNLSKGSTGWISGVVNSAQYGTLKQQMTAQMGGFPVPPSFDQMVIRQLADLLDVHMGTILIGAWRKHQEIMQYRDTRRYPPDDVHVVPLLEHTITSRHMPTIQPIINNVPLPKIKFDVVLGLKMKGAMLKIKAAKITEILVGECLGNGAIEYEGLTIVQRDTAPVDLPGSLVLKEAIAL